MSGTGSSYGRPEDKAESARIERLKAETAARRPRTGARQREALERIAELKGPLDYVSVQALSIANANL